MIDPATLSWAVPAGLKLLGGIFGKKQKVRRPTEAINYYSRIKNDGMYSPSARSAMMGRAGGDMGNIEQQAVADIRGRLASNGMGNSIAGVRALSAPGMQRMRSLGEMSQEISAENERSKIGAGEKLAGIMSDYNQARADARREDRNFRLNSLLDAAGTAAGGIVDNAFAGQMEDFDKTHAGIQSFIMSGGDLNSPDFAAMYEKAYGIKWPGYGAVTGKTGLRSLAPAGGYPGVGYGGNR